MRWAVQVCTSATYLKQGMICHACMFLGQPLRWLAANIQVQPRLKQAVLCRTATQAQMMYQTTESIMGSLVEENSKLKAELHACTGDARAEPSAEPETEGLSPRVQSMLDAQAASIHQLKMDLGEHLAS